jgi:hypothetical protein
MTGHVFSVFLSGNFCLPFVGNMTFCVRRIFGPERDEVT